MVVVEAIQVLLYNGLGKADRVVNSLINLSLQMMVLWMSLVLFQISLDRPKRFNNAVTNSMSKTKRFRYFRMLTYYHIWYRICPAAKCTSQPLCLITIRPRDHTFTFNIVKSTFVLNCLAIGDDYSWERFLS